MLQEYISGCIFVHMCQYICRRNSHKWNNRVEEYYVLCTFMYVFNLPCLAVASIYSPSNDTSDGCFPTLSARWLHLRVWYLLIWNMRNTVICFLSLSLFFFFFFFLLFRTAPVAYGSSQARGWIRAAAVLHLSRSNTGCQLWLRPIPPDTQPTEQGQGSNPHPHRY